MLGLSGVEMITWQTRQAVEKPATLREPTILYFLWKIPKVPVTHAELFIPMETNEMES